LRTTSIQEGEDDDDITTSDTTTPSIEVQGPITRLRAEQLHRQVNSFLCSIEVQGPITRLRAKQLHR
jgi:hypothetical protein